MRAEAPATNAWSGVLFGIAVAAFVDEAVFHQLLHWHHFYDLGTPALGLVSDGLFHALSFFAAIASLFLVAHLRRRGAWRWRRWLGGVLTGCGAFQLYDGTVQHKLLGIHQIRYVPDLLPYDLVWDGVAVILLAAGIVLIVATRRREPAAARESGPA
jgi:uncharacterized membrane protein